MDDGKNRWHGRTGGRAMRARGRLPAADPGRALLCGVALAIGTSAWAAGPDLAFTAAVGQNEHVRKAGVVLGFTRAEPLWQGAQWRLGLRHELELAAWRVPHARNILELGYSPVLRLERPDATGDGVFFVEGSIGVRLLSHTRLSPTRSLSTAFQFADMLGLGWQRGRSTLGLRLQHISNGDIKKPNPGINFAQVYYRYRF